MPLQNSWVSYIDRTYQQIKDAVIAKVKVEVPELTDHNESNLFIKLVSIWAGLTEMVGYYLDNWARETHIVSTRMYENMLKHARFYDYRVHGVVSATVDVTFTLSGPAVADTTIPANTEVITGNNIRFFTVEDLVIPLGETSGTVGAIQGELITAVSLGTGTGVVYQEYEINNVNVADGTVVVRVNGITWESQETLGYSISTDNHYVQTTSKDKKPLIQFGDGVAGAIPPNGSTLEVDYRVSLGEAGNVAENTLTTIVPTLTIPGGLGISVTNAKAASGGAPTETIEQMRRRIPISTRTLKRAVRRIDYIELPELVPGVAKAGVGFDCGKKVTIYVVPEGGGIASSVLLDAVEAYMDERKMITTLLDVQTAGEVGILLSISITVKPNYSKTEVTTAVKASLVEFFAPENQMLKGEVHLSDIYQIVETTVGVQNSQITKMTTRSYARPLGATSVDLDWIPITQPSSNQTLRWEISFLNANDYQLFREGDYIGTFSVGLTVIQPEIYFTVIGSYTVGDKWEFYTYPYFGTVILAEQSIPTLQESDIIINTIGGI
jgi:uncharacterized phage protein gp47/JayE